VPRIRRYEIVGRDDDEGVPEVRHKGTLGGLYVRDNELTNLVMTSHMSGWSSSRVLRRQQTIAENIRRLLATKLL
jgi:hypothetical protein